MTKTTFPAQTQDHQPGLTQKMDPQPIIEDPHYKSAQKLKGKVALISGGDSGIGAAVAILYAKEGADVSIIYLEEDEDAKAVKERIEQIGQSCLLIRGDIGSHEFCHDAVKQTLAKFGKINILVNNAAEQHPQKSLEDITPEQFEHTFQTNIFGYYSLTHATLPHLSKGDCIINTSSVTAYEGNEGLIDYSSTKGAITTFTRSLAANLASDAIRVNSVAPGPIWTPLIPSTFSAEHVKHFGADTPMGRAGQPSEVAPAYVFLAAHQDSSYITGHTIHPNGGKPVES